MAATAMLFDYLPQTSATMYARGGSIGYPVFAGPSVDYATLSIPLHGAPPIFFEPDIPKRMSYRARQRKHRAAKGDVRTK